MIGQLAAILSSDWRSDHSKCRATSGERRLVYAQKTDVRMVALDTNTVTPVVAKTRSNNVIVIIDNYNIGWRRHLLCTYTYLRFHLFIIVF